MEILFLSEDGNGLGLADIMSREDNQVNMFIRNGGASSGVGIVNRVESWRPYVKTADFIVCDDPVWAKHEDVFKTRSRAVVGASLFGNMINKKKRGEFLRNCGVEPGELDAFPTLIHGFFNGRDFLKPLLFSEVEMFMFPGRLGSMVDCMGCVVKAIKKKMPFEDEIAEGLRKANIRGMVTLVYNQQEELGGVFEGFYYDVIEAVCEGLKIRVSDFLYDIAMGTAKEFPMTDDFVVVVRLTMPPWPYASEIPFQDNLFIEGITEGSLKHLFLCDMQYDKELDEYRPGFGTGLLLKASARGRADEERWNLREPRRRVYRTLESIEFPNKQYRLDIGAQTLRDERIRSLLYEH